MKQAFQFELSHLFIIGNSRDYLTKKAVPWWGIATFVYDYYEKVGAGHSSILIRSKLYDFPGGLFHNEISPADVIDSQ